MLLQVKEAEEEIARLQAFTADWKMKHDMMESEVTAKHETITERERTIAELQERCEDLTSSLMNQVRNTEAELGRLAEEAREQGERSVQLEEGLLHRGQEMEHLQEERRRREKEWGKVLGAVEGQAKELEHEVAELREEVVRLEEDRSGLRGRAVVVEREHRQELEVLTEELEEVRGQLTKRIHQLEEQVGTEQDRWAKVAREKRGLEERLSKVVEQQGAEETVARLKAELRKKAVLLKDAQSVIERQQGEGGSRQVVKQLKAQLEEAEHARTTALRSRRHGELEVEDMQEQLEEVSRGRGRLEEKLSLAIRENTELASRLQDGEEEMAEVMRKYRASVAAIGTDQITLQNQADQIHQLEAEKNKLREEVGELRGRLDTLEEGSCAGEGSSRRAELKVTELEHKLELEVAGRVRLESQVARLKDAKERMEKVTMSHSGLSPLSVQESEELRFHRQAEQEKHRRLLNQCRDLKEDYLSLQGKEADVSEKKTVLEKVSKES